VLTNLFCQNCQTYLSPVTTSCSICGLERSPVDRLPTPGELFWRAQVEGPGHDVLPVDEFVLIGWGQRGGSGGVSALDRFTGRVCWTLMTQYGVEGGLIVVDDQLYFATLSFLGNGARLYCLALETGQVTWQRELSGGVCGQPLVSEARVTIGCDDGTVQCFDRRTGEPVCDGWRFERKGRVWLAAVHGDLMALSESGQIMALDPLHLRPFWTPPLVVECRITTPPAVCGDYIYFGTLDGQVYRLQPRRKELSVFVQGLGQLKAAPVFQGDQVLIAGRDHYLRAFDVDTGLENWSSPEFAHGLVATPFGWEDLVLVAINGGEVVLLAADSGEIIWRYQLPVARGLMAHPIMAEGVVYAGSDTGEIVALSWALDQYAWAADRFESLNQSLEAGTYATLAGFYAAPQERSVFNARAVKSWLNSPHPEWAAYLQESDITVLPKEVAQTYQQAGENLSASDPRLAVELLLSAGDWYEQAEDNSSAQHCRQMASRLTHGPHLNIQGVQVPTTWQEEQCFTTVIELKNFGKRSANQIWVRFSGALKTRVWVQFDHLHPKRQAEVEAPLAAHEPGFLVVDVRYHDDQEQEYTTRKQFKIQAVQPFNGILVEGSVGMLSLDDLPDKVIVRGDVGVCKVQASDKGPVAEPKDKIVCPACSAVNLSDAQFCEQCSTNLSAV
jgi:outer membrane protein assembly factor BamB